MAEKIITIQNILGGLRPSSQFAGSGQYGPSLGIDPDLPITDSDTEPSGIIRPSAVEAFSSTNIDDTPLWFITNPKDTKIRMYTENGKLVSYTNALATETLDTTATTASGNGAAYYDDYIYLAKDTTIARFGTLSGGSPSVTQSYWVTTLSLTALTDTTYPTVGGVEMPNHVMHYHRSDDRLYFCDVNSSGVGIINFIQTTGGGTNAGSTYQALDFDNNLYPVALASLENNLVVGLIDGTDITAEQNRAVLSVWDGAATAPLNLVQREFPDPLITALLNVNGVIWVFSGSAQGGCRVTQYFGGFNFQEVAYIPYVLPPLQGAVDHKMGRVSFGTRTTKPSTAPVVVSIGSKFPGMSRGVHITHYPSISGNNPYVSALKYATQEGPALLTPIIGVRSDSADDLYKRSTTYSPGSADNVWTSEKFRIGRNFTIKKVELSLSTAVASNITITPTITVDNGATAYTGSTYNLAAIDSSSGHNGKRKINLYPQGVNGEHNFEISFTFSGSALCGIGMPIVITYEDNE